VTFVKTSLTIDDDVLDKAHAVAGRLRTPFRRVVNEALRAGWQTVAAPAERKAYRTHDHGLGMEQGSQGQTEKLENDWRWN
jgi:hypothetical protein